MASRSMIAAVLLITGLAFAGGCNSPKAATGDRDMAHIKVLGIIYGRYMTSLGAAPGNQEQLIGYLQSEPANWEKLASSPQEFLASTRQGQRLVVLYGKDVKAPDGGGLPWVAYEQTAVDGKRMIANARGNVQLVDDQEFQKLFSKP